MKERPILMNGPMVRAIQERRKWQTRRVVKPQPPRQLYGIDANDFNTYVLASRDNPDEPDWSFSVRCPYGRAGDRLWVRETWRVEARGAMGHLIDYRANPGSPELVLTRADEASHYVTPSMVWRPSIHMPRWASRITLNVVSVRVEQLQCITLDDMRAEGVRPDNEVSLLWRESLRANFIALWDSTTTNPAYLWAANPFVWVVTFEVPLC